MMTPLPKNAALKISAESWFWVFVVFLFASARLFEEGLSLDPAIYSLMARNFAEIGGWTVGGGKYFFPDFPDHPYLFMWIQGFFFRGFGASDFTARLPSLIFGCGTLFFFHSFLSRNFGAFRANLFSFLTVVSAPFVGRFATPYLEPTYFFFFVASLDLFDRGLAKVHFWWLLGAALLFVAAFFTKGIALLPGLALIFYWGTIEKKAFQPLLLWGGLTVICGLAAIAIQTVFAEFPFWDRYFYLAFFKRATQSRHFFADQINFLILIARLHPFHVVLALIGVGAAAKRTDERSFFFFGLVGLLLFGVANGVLGKLFHHYTYPAIAFVNIMAVTGVTRLLAWQGTLWRAEPHAIRRWALKLAIFYQVLWNLFPFSMRRKPYADFFQFRPKIAAMKAMGLAELQGHSLSDADWLYPALSLWYWKIDTRHIDSLTEFKNGALLTAREVNFEANPKVKLCASSEHYKLWTTETLANACLEAHAPKWGE